MQSAHIYIAYLPSYYFKCFKIQKIQWEEEVEEVSDECLFQKLKMTLDN